MTSFQMVTLGSVCEPVRRVDPMLLGTEMFRYIDLSSVDQEKKMVSESRTLPTADAPGRARQLIQSGDILVSTVRPNLNAVALVAAENEGAIASTGFCVLRPRLDQVLPEFMFAWVRTRMFIEEASSKAQGASYPAVTDRVVTSMSMPLPPVDEQRRLVAKLDGIWNAIDATSDANDSAAGLTQDVLDAALTELFGDLFERHLVSRLGDVMEIARGGSPRPISEFITEDEDGVNWIKIGDASASRKYIYSTRERIKPSGVSRSRMVYDGDFLLSNSMSFGRPYIMRTTGCIHDGWLVLRDNEKKFDQDFLYYLLGSRLMYDEFSKRAQGSTVQNLNSSLVADVRIPVPPLDVQVEASAYARELDESAHRLGEIYSSKSTKLETYRQSVLEAAFRGEL